MVENVIQTATKVVDGGLAAREAFTVLATLTREAVPAARRLRETDPDRAAAYRELILALGRELRRREQTSDEPRHVRAVTDDLAKVLDALRLDADPRAATDTGLTTRRLGSSASPR